MNHASIPIAVLAQCEALDVRSVNLLVLTAQRVDALASHFDAWSEKRERWELLRSAPDATFGVLIDGELDCEPGEIRARLIAAHAERCVAAHRAAQALIDAVSDDAWLLCARLQSELTSFVRTHISVPSLTHAACERFDAAPAISERLADIERRISAVRAMCCGVGDMQLKQLISADTSFDDLAAQVARLDALRRAKRVAVQ